MMYSVASIGMSVAPYALQLDRMIDLTQAFGRALAAVIQALGIPVYLYFAFVGVALNLILIGTMTAAITNELIGDYV